MIRYGKEWKRKSQRPNESGCYTVANDNFSCITISSPYSKKYDLWGVTDETTPEEIEKFTSIPIVAELMRGENGWWN